jgi:hypothetical protein
LFGEGTGVGKRETAPYRPGCGSIQGPEPSPRPRFAPVRATGHTSPPPQAVAGRSYGLIDHARFNRFALANSIYSRSLIMAQLIIR